MGEILAKIEKLFQDVKKKVKTVIINTLDTVLNSVLACLDNLSEKMKSSVKDKEHEWQARETKEQAEQIKQVVNEELLKMCTNINSKIQKIISPEITNDWSGCFNHLTTGISDIAYAA